MHVMSYNVHVNPRPQPETFEDSELTSVAAPDSIPQLLYRIEIRAY